MFVEKFKMLFSLRLSMASCNVQTIKINIFKNMPDDKLLREH